MTTAGSAGEVTTPGSAGATAPPERQMLLFLPGISALDPTRSLDGVARLIRDAVDAAANPRQVFTLKQETRTLGRDDNAVTLLLYTVCRQEGADERPLLDICSFDYNALVQADYDNQSFAQRWAHLLFALVAFGFAFVPRFTWQSFVALVTLRWLPAALRPGAPGAGPGKGWVEQFQMLLALLWLLLVVAYMFVLVAATLSAIKDAGVPLPGLPSLPVAMPTSTGAAPAGPLGLLAGPWALLEAVAQAAGRLAAWAQEKSQAIVIALAALGVVVPSRQGVRTVITRAAVVFIALVLYLTVGLNRNLFIGQLQRMVQGLNERTDLVYSKIHVVGFSFGSVVAIDTLLPANDVPANPFDSVVSLTTIGCPFDFVRTFWPDYFDSRYPLLRDSVAWLNVYSPADLLGSNFRDDSLFLAPNQSVRLADDAKPIPAAPSGARPAPPAIENKIYAITGGRHPLTLVETLLFLGLRAHGQYFQPTYDGARSCFDVVLKELQSRHQIVPELKPTTQLPPGGR